jgi:hypothetical protein
LTNGANIDYTTLQKKLSPELEHGCINAAFAIFDFEYLRWGISQSILKDHLTKSVFKCEIP